MPTEKNSNLIHYTSFRQLHANDSLFMHSQQAIATSARMGYSLLDGNYLLYIWIIVQRSEFT